MKRNDKVRVKESAKFHGGKIGYFQFYGQGESEGCAILAEEKNVNPSVLFVVGTEEIEPI